nr:hypothetical protein [Afifella marina]
MIDENLPPALARALNEILSPDHEVQHLRQLFPPATSDRHWIEELSAQGRWVVISGDRRITRTQAERYAFRNSRLVGFFLSRALTKAKTIKQMERLLALWETIETQAAIVEGGAMFELPMKSTRLRQIKER